MISFKLYSLKNFMMSKSVKKIRVIRNKHICIYVHLCPINISIKIKSRATKWRIWLFQFMPNCDLWSLSMTSKVTKCFRALKNVYYISTHLSHVKSSSFRSLRCACRLSVQSCRDINWHNKQECLTPSIRVFNKINTSDLHNKPECFTRSTTVLYRMKKGA